MSKNCRIQPFQHQSVSRSAAWGEYSNFRQIVTQKVWWPKNGQCRRFSWFYGQILRFDGHTQELASPTDLAPSHFTSCRSRIVSIIYQVMCMLILGTEDWLTAEILRVKFWNGLNCVSAHRILQELADLAAFKGAAMITFRTCMPCKVYGNFEWGIAMGCAVCWAWNAMCYLGKHGFFRFFAMPYAFNKAATITP